MSIISPSRLKAACNRSHALRRIGERYGLRIHRSELREIESMIREGSDDVVMLRPDHRGKDRALYAVRWEDCWLLPVFDFATNSIVTFLPKSEGAFYRHILDPVPSLGSIKP